MWECYKQITINTMKKLLFVIAIVSLLIGCSKDDNKVKSITATPTSMSMHYDEESEIKMSYSPADAPAPTYTYAASDEYVATVDQDGLVSGCHVGECVVGISTTDGISTECTVTIKPRSMLYVEPYLEFGGSASDIKRYEKRAIYSETASGLIYKGENSNVRYVVYVLENGKMKSSGVLLANTSYCVNECNEYLSERYDAMGVYEGVIMFNGRGKIIGFSLDESLGLNTLYISESSAKSYDYFQIDKAKEALLDLMGNNRF